MSRASSNASSFEILPAHSRVPTRSPSGLSIATTRPTSAERFVIVDRSAANNYENRPVSRTSSHTYASIPSESSSYIPSRVSTPRGSTQADRSVGQSVNSRSVTPRSTSLSQAPTNRTSANSTASSIRPNSHNQVVLNRQPVRTSTPNLLQQAIGNQLSQLQHSTLPPPGQQIATFPPSVPSTLPPPYPASSTNSTTSRTSDTRQSIVKPPRAQSQASGSSRPFTSAFEPVRSKTPQTVALPSNQPQQHPSMLPIQQNPAMLPIQSIAHPTAIRPQNLPITYPPSEQPVYDEVASVRSVSRATPQNLPTQYPQMPGVPLSYVPHPALDGPNAYPILQQGVQPGTYPNIYPNIQQSVQPGTYPNVYPSAQPPVPPIIQQQIPVQAPIVTSPEAEDTEPPPPYSIQTNAIAPYMQPQAYGYPPQIVNHCSGCSNHFTGPSCRPSCCCCRCQGAQYIFVSSCGGPCYSSCC